MTSKRPKIISNVFLIICCAVSILPIIFTFTNSLMSSEEINSRYTEYITEENKDDYNTGNIHFVNFTLVPSEFSLEQHFKLYFDNPVYLRYFWNTVLLVVPILVGQCLIAPIGAYGFEALQFKWKEVIFFIYIVIMLMPMQILLVPNFIVAGWFNIRDSYLAIILPAMFHPLGVFLIRQQMKGFPKDALEAARLDGASEFKVFRKIVRPNMTSVIAALVILLFADNWNIVDQAVVFISNFYDMPLSVSLNSVASSEPQMFFAVSCLFITPAILIFLYGQDYLVEGISLSSIKA